MRVYLKKAFKEGNVELNKGDEGFIWCCLIHSDSFIVDFKKIRVEISRSQLEFFPTK